MKKKISINLIGVIVLIIALIVSLSANILQFAKIPPTLMGSYGLNQTDYLGENPYLIFDDKGNYCKYTQADGLLDKGTYTQDTTNQYTLIGDTGNTEKIILEEDGLYYISSNGTPSVVFFPRFSNVPTFIGSWAKSWPGWEK